MKINFNEIIMWLVNEPQVIKATKYISPKLIVRATRKLYGKKLPSKYENTTVVLTIGRPNYVEREFIKELKQAGEPFPVRNTQLKLYNPKKKKLK